MFITRWLIVTLILSLSLCPALIAQAGDAKGSDIYFRGPIAAISRDSEGNAGSLTIQVNRSQVTVRLSFWTQLYQGRGFRYDSKDLKLGDFLAVDGFFTASGTIVARRIHVETGDDVGVEGVLETIEGDAVTVNGILFRLTADSYVHTAGSEVPKGLSFLDRNRPVRLRAQLRDGELQVIEAEIGARTVENEPLRFEGTVSAIEGQLISVDVGVDAVDALVAYDDATTMTGYLAIGTRVEVEGWFIPGTSGVRAVRIAVDENENENFYDEGEAVIPGMVEFDISGSVSRVDRTMSGKVHRLQVGEQFIQVDNQTLVRFSDGPSATLDDLAVGQTVVIEGTRKPDNTLHADLIVIEVVPVPPPEPEPETISGRITSVQRGPNGVVTRFHIEQQLFRLAADCQISRGNESNLSSEVLDQGQLVEVVGTRQSDGSILARSVRILE